MGTKCCRRIGSGSTAGIDLSKVFVFEGLGAPWVAACRIEIRAVSSCAA